MEVASADLLCGQSQALATPITTTEVMTSAITLPPKEVRFAGWYLKVPMPPHYKHLLCFVISPFWASMPISSQDLIVFFCGFGVAFVALNLYKLAQPAKG